jgi:hypothetical protein
MCFGADEEKGPTREIRKYFIPDFSEWKQRDKCKKASFGLAQDKF